MSDMRSLRSLFGSASTIAKAAGVDKAAVLRWPPKEGIRLEYQRRIVAGAIAQGLSAKQAAHGVGAVVCPCCSRFVDGPIRDMVEGQDRADA